MAPAQIELFGDFILDFNTYCWSNHLAHSFLLQQTLSMNILVRTKGYEGSTAFLTAGFITYSFLVIYGVTVLSPADFWMEVNSTDNTGNAFNINFAYKTIFRQGLGIIIGSLTAFLIGQFLDVLVFQRLRKYTGEGKIWLRATGSTLVSQLIDSFVVLFIAFYVFGNWTLEQMLSVGIINYIYKGALAILLTPLLYVAHYFIDNYLGKDSANEMAEEAADSDFF